MDVKPSDVNICKVAVFALGGLFDSQVLMVSKVAIFQHFPATFEKKKILNIFRTAVTGFLKTD